MNVLRNLMFLVATAAIVHAPVHAQFFDFESSDGNWIGSDDWAWGAPSGVDGSAIGGSGATEPSAGASGSNVWGTVLGGLHSASTVSSLTQTFDLSLVSDASMSFMEWSDSGAPDFDWGEVLVNGDSLYTSDGDSMQAWRQVDLDLSAYDGMSSVDVEFRFTASAVVERVGWYIDDVNLTAVPEPVSLVPLSLAVVGIVAYRRSRKK